MNATIASASSRFNTRALPSAKCALADWPFDVTADLGATMPSLIGIAVGSLAVGGLLLIGGVLLIVGAIRRSRASRARTV